MIRKNYKRILPILAVAFVVWFIQGHVAHAGLFDLNAWDFVWAIASNGVQVFLTMASWLVGVTGTLLNVSVYLTTHIGDFVNNSDVIFKVWGIIRDLASMILIFIILWAAMQMILGIKQANFSSLIFSIIIMGILINFSFFFARVMIDASNIATLEFYDAITPGKPQLTSTSSWSDWTNGAWRDGGLSDIFMGALSVTKWYDTGKVISANNDGSGGATTASTPLRILLIGVGGVIVMVLASLSFIGAAAACILRLAVLIFLLAFSPIWIAAMAMPQLKKASDMWWGQFKAHLLFLPVYMMLMYVAIRILAESKLNMLAVSSQSGLANTGSMGDFTSLFVGFAIVLVMLNAPLIGAVSIAGAGSKLTESWFKGARSWLGKNTVGRASYMAAHSKTFGRIASVAPGAGLAISKGLSLVGNADIVGGKKGGYEATLKAQKKAYSSMYENIGKVDKTKYKNAKELEEAESAAKDRQAKYLSNLGKFSALNPLRWAEGLTRTTVFSRTLKSRAAQETVLEINEKASKKALLKGLGKNKKERDQKQKELDSLNERLEREAAGTGFAAGKAPSQTDLDKQETLKKRITELDEIIEKAEEEKDKQNVDRIIAGVKDKEGGDKEEKKGGGDSDKNKK